MKSTFTFILIITFSTAYINAQITGKTPADGSGNTYNWIKIGDQYWMSENLTTTKFINGNDIPTGYTNAEWLALMNDVTNTGTPAYASYPSAESTDGFLYNWFAVTDSRGICPEGWKVPDDDDWIELEVYAGMLDSIARITGWRHTNYEGEELKSTTRCFGGTDIHGFKALPSGQRNKDNGTFTGYDVDAYFWTATQNTDDYPTATLQSYRRIFRNTYRNINRSVIKKNAGMSVRCIKSNTKFSTSVGSYNILGADVTTKGPLWYERKLHVKDIVLQENNFPDILGVQDCILDSQKNDMIDMLDKDYDYHLSGLGTSTRLIFWKPQKYNLLEADMVDILKGKYPDMYIKQRYAHFIRLKEKNTDKEILVYNVQLRAGADTATHALRKECIDSLCNIASTKSAQLGNLPVIVMGDMNARPGTVIGGIPSSPVIFSQHGFIDTFSEADTIINGNYYTYTSLDEVLNCRARVGLNGSGRIDYILTYPDDRINVLEYLTILNFVNEPLLQLECPLPSDHHPVKSALKISYPIEMEEYDYDSILIGNQYWMTENLKTTRFANGDYIPTQFPDSQWITLFDETTNTGTPAFAIHPDAEEADGFLYNWFAATDPRGICPNGWRVPSDEDWIELEVSAGMLDATARTEGWRHTDYEGRELKSTTRSFGGTDIHGFNVLPSGHREKDGGTFAVYDNDAYFWTNQQATGHSTAHLQGWRRVFRKNYTSINRSPINKAAGQSIRCVKDYVSSPSPSPLSSSTDIEILSTIENEIIYSISGMRIYSSVDNLPQGIYVKKIIYANGEIETKKIMRLN